VTFPLEYYFRAPVDELLVLYNDVTTIKNCVTSAEVRSKGNENSKGKREARGLFKATIMSHIQ
jgi:hypothetical protein